MRNHFSDFPSVSQFSVSTIAEKRVCATLSYILSQAIYVKVNVCLIILPQIFLWGTEGDIGRAGGSTEETSRQEVSEALGFDPLD